MKLNATRTRAWTFTGKAILLMVLVSCASGPMSSDEHYSPGPALAEWQDPLAGRTPHTAWNPPRQFAVYVFPHVDPDQEVAIGGHWILMNLTNGSWYFEGSAEREIVPDAKLSKTGLDAARRSLGEFQDVVIPYRPVKR